MPTRQEQMALAKRNARRMSSPFREFMKYEGGRERTLRFDVNALADFEQETGMGFAQLMKQRAIFANARAMLWAGLKHEDRGISIEYVGDLIGDYLTDDDIEDGDHTIDTLLMVAFEAAIEQRALGLRKSKEEPASPAPTTNPDTPQTPEVLDAEDPTPRPH